MLKREINPIAVVEVLFGLILIVMFVGFAASGGADPSRFALGVGAVSFALVACEGVRRQRRAEPDALASEHVSASRIEANRLGYRFREGILGAVLIATVAGLIFVEGRARVAFGFFAIVSFFGLINVERLRRQARRNADIDPDPPGDSNDGI